MVRLKKISQGEKILSQKWSENFWKKRCFQCYPSWRKKNSDHWKHFCIGNPIIDVIIVSVHSISDAEKKKLCLAGENLHSPLLLLCQNSFKEHLVKINSASSDVGALLQSGASSCAKHGGAYFSAVRGSIKDLTAVPGRDEVQEC